MPPYGGGSFGFAHRLLAFLLLRLDPYSWGRADFLCFMVPDFSAMKPLSSFCLFLPFDVSTFRFSSIARASARVDTLCFSVTP